MVDTSRSDLFFGLLIVSSLILAAHDTYRDIQNNIEKFRDEHADLLSLTLIIFAEIVLWIIYVVGAASVLFVMVDELIDKKQENQGGGCSEV